MQNIFINRTMSFLHIAQLSFVICLLCVGTLQSVFANPNRSTDSAQNSAQTDSTEWIALTEQDLAPISLGKHEAKIRTALKKGEWSYAARLLHTDQAPLQFLKAWFHAQAEEWQSTINTLKGLEAHPILNDEVNALLGQAYLKLKQADLAEAAGAKVSKVDQALWFETLRSRGQALRALKKWDEASKVYEHLGQSEDDFEKGISLLGLGMVDLERGEVKSGLRRLKTIDIDYHGLWVASQARREAKALVKKDPQYLSFWYDRSLAEQVRKLESALKRGQTSKVIDKVNQLLKQSLSDDLKCRALIVKGRSYDKSRKRSQALSTLSEAIKICHPQRHPQTPLALYVAGRAASIIDDYDQSNAFFNTLLREYKHRLSDDAAVFLVRHASQNYLQTYGQKQSISALLKLKVLTKAQRKQLKKLSGKKAPQLQTIIDVLEILVKRHPDGDLSSEALIFGLVGVLRAGRLDLAQKLINLSTQLTPSGFRFHDAGRNLYWQARVKALMGEKTKATQLYKLVLSNAPVSWHALMAYSRLYEFNKKDAQKAVKASINWTPNGLGLPGGEQHRWDWRFRSDDPHWALMKRALLWMRLGLMKRGRRAFRELASYTDRPDLQWLSAWALDGYQQYHWSHDIPRRKLIEYRHFPPSGYHLKHWSIAYPAPFQTEVLQAAKDESVEAQFIWGVMREESGYAERIRSSASAVGLLQLILPTAKMMREKSEPEITVDRLGIPKVNIPLGARYLAWVKRNVNCAWALVPSGYNAGGGALKSWIKDRGHLPLDLFVETIPYEEARWYNKRVVASWVTFRTLYGVAKGQFLWPYVSQRTKVPEDSPPKKTKAKSSKKRKTKRKAKSSKKRKTKRKAKSSKKRKTKRKAKSSKKRKAKSKRRSTKKK